jgi:hypothetical protein
MSALPGYTPLSDDSRGAITAFKLLEEQLLRTIERISEMDDVTVDPRWRAVAVTHFQTGFMAIVRAVARPTRLDDAAIKGAYGAAAAVLDVTRIGGGDAS